MAGPVLEIANLSVAIRGSGDRPHAVRGINITVGAKVLMSLPTGLVAGIAGEDVELIDPLLLPPEARNPARMATTPTANPPARKSRMRTSR